MTPFSRYTACLGFVVEPGLEDGHPSVKSGWQNSQREGIGVTAVLVRSIIREQSVLQNQST